jgi:hypothetical protein
MPSLDAADAARVAFKGAHVTLAAEPAPAKLVALPEHFSPVDLASAVLRLNT